MLEHYLANAVAPLFKQGRLAVGIYADLNAFQLFLEFGEKGGILSVLLDFHLFSPFECMEICFRFPALVSSNRRV